MKKAAKIAVVPSYWAVRPSGQGFEAVGFVDDRPSSLALRQATVEDLRNLLKQQMLQVEPGVLLERARRADPGITEVWF